MRNSIIHGDFFEKAKDIEDKCIDLVLTDPPYNISSTDKITYVGEKPKSTKEAWGDSFDDEFTEPDYMSFMENLSDIYKRVLKDSGSILIFFDRSRPYYLTPFYKKFKFENMICFVKTNPLPHVRKNNYRSSFELCAWFSNKSKKVNFLSQSKMKNVFHGSIGSTKQTKHPTEKYLWQIEPLILRHSNKNDLVLDSFGGSGTTAVSCIQNGRDYLLYEKKEEFYNMAVNRVKDLIHSPLFHPEN